MYKEGRIKHFARLNKYFIQKYERYLPTAFDESLTLLEKVNKVIEGLNTIVRHINDQSEALEEWQTDLLSDLDTTLDDYVSELTTLKEKYETFRQQILDDILPESTSNILNKWLENGTLEQIINDNIFNDINTKLSKMAQKVKLTESTASLLHTGKRERKTIVTFIVDDGIITDYTKLKPIVEEKGVPLGLGIVTSWMDNEGYMNTSQIKEMESLGCEIMSHSHTHRDFATLSAREQHNEFKNSKEILESKGFYPRCFVYPYNSTDVNSRKALPHYYQAGFAKETPGNGSMSGVNTPRLRNREIGRNALGSYFDRVTEGFPEDTTSLEYYKALVDYAEEIENWLVFVLHSEPMNNTQVQHFSDIIDYIRAKGIDIVSPSEGLDIYGNIIEVEGKKSLTVDADGNLTSDDVIIVLDKLNARTPSDNIFEYRFNKITHTPISNTFASSHGFPSNRGGLLETFRVTSEYYHGFQIYNVTIGDKERFVRYLKSNHEWDEWISLVDENNFYISQLNDYSVSDSWITFPFKSVTQTPISRPFAQSENFPSPRAGTLVTYRLTSEYWTGKQEFITSAEAHHSKNEMIWERFVQSDMTWGEWKIKGELLLDETTDSFTINAHSTHDITISDLEGVNFRDVVTIVPKSTTVPDGVMFQVHRVLQNYIIVRFANVTSDSVSVDSIGWGISVRPRIG